MNHNAAPFLSVIIPAYNEEVRLPDTLRLIQEYLDGAPYTWEIVVMDDGSTDRTVTVAREACGERSNCRVIKAARNQGKGAAIRRGMLEARGRYRLFTDADNSTPIQETAKLLRRMRRARADVAIGSRAVRGAQLEVRQPLHREMMGRFFNVLVQLLVLPGIHDTQCGFKIFTARAAKAIFPHQRLDGFSFDVEILWLARQQGYRIIEVPIRWINSPASRVSPIRDSVHVFADLIRIRFGLLGHR